MLNLSQGLVHFRFTKTLTLTFEAINIHQFLNSEEP